MEFEALSFVIFEPDRNENYGRPRELPTERDVQIRDLLLRVVDLETFEHATLSMPPGADIILTVFAEHAASMAVRQRDSCELRAGLVAAAIAHTLTDDFRDVLPVLAPLYRACELIGLDPDSEFRAANECCGGQAAVLIDFANRVPCDKSLESMKYVEGSDDRGFRFISTW